MKRLHAEGDLVHRERAATSFRLVVKESERSPLLRGRTVSAPATARCFASTSSLTTRHEALSILC